jgi:sugar phosphate isomerase/epimerase
MTRREVLAAAGIGAAAPLWARKRIDRSRISAITDEIGKTADDAIAFAKEYGLQWVELRGVPGEKKSYSSLPEPEVKAAAASFARNGLKVSFLNTGLLKFTWPGTEPVRRRQETPEGKAKRQATEKALFDRRLDDLKTAIRNAHILGVDKVRVFTGMRVAEPRSMFPRIAEVIGEMAHVAGKEKIYLGIENEGSCNVASSQELADILKMMPSKWVGFNWDPQNTLGTKEKPFPDGYNVLPKKRMLNVQIKGKGVMPASDQKLDWKAIMQGLQTDGYPGKIGLETHIFDGTLIEAAHVSMKEILRIVGELS